MRLAAFVDSIGGTMATVVPRDLPLVDLLSKASSADLNILADLITDNEKGRVALDSKVKITIWNHRAKGSLRSISDVLEAEIRAFGSNSIANMFRSSGVSYVELATDVAKKLDGKPSASHDIFDVEEIVMRQALSQIKGVKTYSSHAELLNQVAQVVKALVSSAGKFGGIAATGGVAAASGAIGGRLLSLIPPLAVVGAGVTIYQATSPAFRITVPAVLQIARIRRIRYEADFAAYQEELRSCL